MTSSLSSGLLQDGVAMSLARALAAANQRAKELGVDAQESLITVTQIAKGSGGWRVNYGPKDYVSVRGGDLIIDVDATEASIQQVLRGQ